MRQVCYPDCPGGAFCSAHRGWSPVCRRCKRAVRAVFPSLGCPDLNRMPPYDLR